MIGMVPSRAIRAQLWTAEGLLASDAMAADQRIPDRSSDARSRSAPANPY
jgi:hypothetical protein